MAKIYDKTTDNTNFPTDKSLILESKDAYHVPFTFGDDWTWIRLGVLMSTVSSDNDNLLTVYDKDIGGFDDPTTTTWFGVNKNLNPLRLPTETGSGGFIGYKADRINGDSSYTSRCGYNNSDAGTDSNTPYQRFIATSGAAEEVAYKVSNNADTTVSAAAEGGLVTCPRVTRVGDPNNYCVANSIEIKIIGKGTSSEKMQIRNNIQRTSAGQDYGDIDTLKDIMDQRGVYNDNMDWFEVDLGSNRWSNYTNYYPDSFLFYNSAPSSGSIRPRIHCWAVKKLA